ncbi:hypothetical protein HJB93_28560 [Rhizobium sp. NLR12b]|uniref:hypothetical protein n=1 Tax=Rhizobium sp. NLR12b TaxID=2731108 RepID=UPI001C828978|nr:hypothetical protein [Rhizobium sp. NLR12b]MBX5303138.1 hypothetical protein [Rhizobium sp. NLR12b]
MSSMDQALATALKEIEALKGRVEELEQALMRDQSGFWHQALNRLANQNLIRGLFHTEILRAAGLIEKSPLTEIEAKAMKHYVEEPGYSLDRKLAGYNLEAVVSELRGEYRTADDFNPIFASKD